MELRSPIRLYWDISPPPEPVPDYDRICAEIASSRVLTLHITDRGETLAAETSGVIGRLAGSPILIMLTVSCPAILEALPLLSTGVKRLYADVATPDDIGNLPAGVAGVSFRVSRVNREELPAIIARCCDSGIAELQLPMERLISGEEPLCLSVAERERLAAEISAITFAGKLNVTANDPFLWRVVHPSTPFPDGICQAANTMLAIDPAGDVYPCPAMPVRLGNLQQSSFREIISSPLKREVRAAILSRPSGCNSCRMLDDCRGGCRGRGASRRGDWDLPDPGCGILPHG